jgi:DNA-binding beta-propeller fold protein YncE
LKKINSILPLSILLLPACAVNPTASQPWTLETVSRYASGYSKGTEIVSVQSSSRRAVLSISLTGETDVLSIADPAHIRRISRFNLGLGPGEELTSVAFHPFLDLFAAAIDAGRRPGRLEIRSVRTGELVNRLIVGFGPDAVVFSGDGKTAVIANEGEDLEYRADNVRFYKPEGSLSIVYLDASGRVATHTNLKMTNVSPSESATKNGSRLLEREVDWNGDGKISDTLDFDRNGLIEPKKVPLGRFEHHQVFGIETKGEKRLMIPVDAGSPALREPEYIAISPDGEKAYVTLQESNEVAVVDLIGERITGYHDLGASRHAADLLADGTVKFGQMMTGLREPDGIALAAKGRYLVTADEGDTEAASNDQPLSGGRTVSVFDAATGALLGDTGSQLDEAAFADQVYPDRHSGKKGTEPEMLVAFELDGTPYVAVGMEKAASVELISLADPHHPQVVSLGKLAGNEDPSPEGIAHFTVNGEHYLLTANEMNGTLECFRIVRN